MNKANARELKRILASKDVRASLQSFLRKASPKKTMKPAKKERLDKEKKTRAELNEETAQIRREVEERAADRCENCTMGPEDGQPGRPAWFSGFDYAEMDHWLGGHGRRLQMQAVENCWLLHKSCHTARQHAEPSAAYWNLRFAKHCKRYGYPFEAHIEHAAIPRRKVLSASPEARGSPLPEPKATQGDFLPGDPEC